MVNLQEKFVINLTIAKALLEELALCKNGCDCGCYDPASEIEACKNGCDCGCASGVELCKDGCDCGCYDPASEIEACKNGCDCGCASGVELCKDGCDCGCSDGLEHNGDTHCDCGCCEDDEMCFAGSGDDDDDDTDKKTRNGKNQKEKCQCGCDHHEHKHSHECNCESEKILANEYLNMARQIQADFDNYRKRNIEAIKDAKNEGIKNAVLEFLPALDAVDRAMEFMQDDQSREGMGMIRKIFEKTFADFKIEPILCLGAHYDPNFHDVVLTEECDKPSGTIIEVIESGYTMDGKVLRHSVVKIAK